MTKHHSLWRLRLPLEFRLAMHLVRRQPRQSVDRVNVAHLLRRQVGRRFNPHIVALCDKP